MWLCWVGSEAWTFWGCRRAEIMFWVGVRDALEVGIVRGTI